MEFRRVRSHQAEGSVEGAEFDLNPGSDTAPVLRLRGGGWAILLSIQWDLKYDTQKPVQQSQEDDLSLPMLPKDYQNVPGLEIDDVVKRLLSLEMANKKEMLKIKKEQLMSKVVENLKDTSSLEARAKGAQKPPQDQHPVFEKTCKELGALCIWVFQEVQKLKKQKRSLKAAVAAAWKQGQRNPESPSKVRPEAIKEAQ
ncbi:hypothetical protein FD755_011557 [Muntiacus reevesi]|uniref:Uncharacterized protein n=1 Tax=Muntiacus reevesi TaxID=9886 RepID=A0A5N3XUQ4_MUNRE|nr:hypothetical protein FD755_011557 [Muntiacus reevesi]